MLLLLRAGCVCARMEPGHEEGWKSESNLNGKPVCLEENKGLFSKEELLGRWNTRWVFLLPWTPLFPALSPFSLGSQAHCFQGSTFCLIHPHIQPSSALRCRPNKHQGDVLWSGIRCDQSHQTFISRVRLAFAMIETTTIFLHFPCIG